MKKVKMKLKYKLMLSYLSIFILIGVIIFIGNFVMGNRFDHYFRARNEEAMDVIAELVIDEINRGNYDFDRLISKLPYGFRVHIEYYDENNQLIAETGKQFSTQAFKEDAAPPKERFLPGLPMESELIKATYEVVLNNENKGHLVISYFKVANFNDNDVDLINQFGVIFRVSIGFIVVFGLLLSFFMARSITKPIIKVTNTADQMRRGNLEARADVVTGTVELNDLSDAINYLATTLQEEEILRRQMTSDMAHEIRTPLTTLRNFLEAFIDGVWEPDEIRLKKSYDEVIRMSILVDQLKDIASLEEGNLKYHDVDFDFSSEIIAICALFEEQFQNKGIHLVLEVAPTRKVHMDPNKLNQIVSNLLSNSLRYTDAKGVVTVKAYSDSKEIHLLVEDTGIGISNEDVNHIFVRFYRAEKSRDRVSGGMGIGLTIVSKLVDMYQGHISVKSEIGIGSTFEIVFPIK